MLSKTNVYVPPPRLQCSERRTNVVFLQSPLLWQQRMYLHMHPSAFAPPPPTAFSQYPAQRRLRRLPGRFWACPAKKSPVLADFGGYANMLTCNASRSSWAPHAVRCSAARPWLSWTRVTRISWRTSRLRSGRARRKKGEMSI